MSSQVIEAMAERLGNGEDPETILSWVWLEAKREAFEWVAADPMLMPSMKGHQIARGSASCECGEWPVPEGVGGVDLLAAFYRHFWETVL